MTAPGLPVHVKLMLGKAWTAGLTGPGKVSENTCLICLLCVLIAGNLGAQLLQPGLRVAHGGLAAGQLALLVLELAPDACQLLPACA